MYPKCTGSPCGSCAGLPLIVQSVSWTMDSGSRNPMTRNLESQKVVTRTGMAFDVSTAGRSGDPLVLMLHGFCASRHSYDIAVADLG